MVGRKPKLLLPITAIAGVIVIIWLIQIDVIMLPAVRVTKHYQDVTMDPIESALIHPIPEADFEALVEHSSKSQTNSTGSDVSFLTSLLIDCGSLLRTNYARTLKKHGASIDDAVAWHTKRQNRDAIEMLLQLRSENQMPSPSIER